MKRCECLSPKPWESNSGKQTNMCKECGGRIYKTPTVDSDIGRVTIQIDAAIRNGDFRSDEERHQFCVWLASSCPERIRQMILTWRANDLPASELAKSQVLDKARRDGVVSGA